MKNIALSNTISTQLHIAEVEYLESTGKQWIDTQVVPTD